MRFLINFFKRYANSFFRGLFRRLTEASYEPERRELDSPFEPTGLPDGILVYLEPVFYSRPPTPHPSFDRGHIDGDDLVMRCVGRP